MQTVINDTPVWITYISRHTAKDNRRNTHPDERDGACYTGWSFCCCLPGCMPDSDFVGPYRTESAAYKAAIKFYSED